MNRRMSKRDRLESELQQLVQEGAPTSVIEATQRALESEESRCDRPDQSWILENELAPESAEEPAESQSGGIVLLVLLKNALAEITFSTKPRMTCEVYELALGFKPRSSDQSLREISKRHNLTVEGLRRNVERVRIKLNLPKLAPHKPDEAIAKYALTNGRERHERIA